MEKLLSTNLSEHSRIATLTNLARNYIYSGHFVEGYKYIVPAYNLAEKGKDTAGLAHAATTLAHYYSHSGMADSAFFYYEIALLNFGLVRDSVQIAGIYNNMGNVYKFQGNIPKALDSYFSSLKLKERMGDDKGVANACTNIGNLYSNFNDTINTLKYLMKGLQIRERMRDTTEMANSYTSLGLYYCKQENFTKAGVFLRDAIKILEQAGDEEGAAIACYNLGNVYYQQGDFQSCEKLYMRALKYSLDNQDLEGIASCYEILGKMKIETGKVNEAIGFFERALKAADESNIAELQLNIHDELYKAFEKNKDSKKALFHFKKWSLLNDSLFNEENIKKLTSTELKYEHEKENIARHAEQLRKEEIAKGESIRKNIIIGSSVVILILVSVFALILFKRLQINRMQKGLIEEQNNEILDSIKYAKRIQNALLAEKSLIEENLEDNFVLFKPKDIVSGDFYWAHCSKNSNSNLFYLAACDSTGHGVPGAFMSLLNIGFLNEAVTENKITEVNEIFNYTRRRLIESISQEGQKDGMDAVLLCFDRNLQKITYAGANIGPVIIRNGKVLDQDYDKMPVGKGIRADEFKSFNLDIENGDRVYLFTDGYADQFGGIKGKKFMYKQLKELLVEISKLPMSEQAVVLEQRFQNWRGTNEQVDDVCVIGFVA